MLVDCDTAITTHMAMAARLARRLAPRHLREDMVAESYLILTQAVERMPVLHSADVSTYLYGAVKKGVLYAIRCQRPTESLPPVTVAADTTADIRELLHICCQTAHERQMVTLRLQRYSYQTIADTMGMSYHLICRTFRRLRKDCLERLYGEPIAKESGKEMES